MGVDHLHGTQIPARIGDVHLLQVAVLAGDLEALAGQREGAIAATLTALHGTTESAPQRCTVRALAPDPRAIEETAKWCRADLGVLAVVVFLLHPRLSQGIELAQVQLGHALQHRHKPSLQGRPKALLFCVLIGTVRQGRLMQDAQGMQPLTEFVRHHGGAVVRHEGAGQASLLQRLREAVHQGLGGLVEVPLQMADQAGMVVDDAEQQWLDPLSGRGEHLPGAVMEIQVPQGERVLDLEAAYLAVLQALLGFYCPGALALRCAPTMHSLRLEKSAQRGVGRQRSQRRVLGYRRGEIVVMQLHAPAGMLLVLCPHPLTQGDRKQACTSGIVAAPATQRADRVLGLAGRIVPTLQRGKAELHRQAAHRVLPLFRGEFLKGFLQRALFRRRGQQRTYDRKAQPRPALQVRRLSRWIHLFPPLLVVGTSRVYPATRRVRDYIFCGSIPTLKKPVQEVVVVAATNRNI